MNDRLVRIYKTGESNLYFRAGLVSQFVRSFVRALSVACKRFGRLIIWVSWSAGLAFTKSEG